MLDLMLLKKKILLGYQIDKSEAETLLSHPLKELCSSANQIREHFLQNSFDVCTIINAKSGKCSENCKFCAQSSFYKTEVETYTLIDTRELVKEAKYNESQGVLRLSIVISGRNASDNEVISLADSIKEIKKESDISICISLGLLNYEQFVILKQAGATRVHNNLETSCNNFPNICTTHTFQDKVKSIKDAQRAGLKVCSGGIMGLLESEIDRIDMAFSLRELLIDSVPINVLNPIAGTPFENNKKLTNAEICRIVAIYRFILPAASIRLAGGRGLLEDKGKACFMSGANAVISGDMLTTVGVNIKQDMQMIKELGFEVKLQNG